jgi:putative sterol carrier protein
MSFCVLGMSEEFKEDGVAVNALWPRTAIATDAIDLIGSVEMRKQSRTVEIMADAAYQILIKNSRTFTGNFVIDEHLLRQECGITNFDKYAVDPTQPLMLDFFLDEEENQKSETLVGTINKQKQSESTTSTSTTATQAASGDELEASMNKIRQLISPELIQKVNGVYLFKISDKNSEWYLDLKNGQGGLTKKFDGKVNCTMTMNSDVFVKMSNGSMKPTSAFMTGKLKIKGDMGLAMKLEKLMSNLKSKL